MENKKIPFRLPEKLYQSLNEYSKKTGISKNELMIIALDEFFKKYDTYFRHTT